MIALSKSKTTGNELISNEIDSSADYWALLTGDRLTCAIAHASIECINMLPRNPLDLTLITIRFFLAVPSGLGCALAITDTLSVKLSSPHL